ncbi:MAG: YdcF family protein [Bacteroidia bacterium]
MGFIFLGIEILLISALGWYENHPNCEIAVVLGNQVMQNGEPSQRLAARLDKAILLYKRQQIKKVVVSGGIGKDGFDEAAVMKKYLCQKGLSASDILMDNQGNTTLLTAQNCAKMLPNYTSQNILVISQFYHLARCQIAFQKAGFQQVYTAPADYVEIRDIYSLLRESVGIWKYLLI